MRFPFKKRTSTGVFSARTRSGLSVRSACASLRQIVPERKYTYPFLKHTQYDKEEKRL